MRKKGRPPQKNSSPARKDREKTRTYAKPLSPEENQVPGKGTIRKGTPSLTSPELAKEVARGLTIAKGGKVGTKKKEERRCLCARKRAASRPTKRKREWPFRKRGGGVEKEQGPILWKKAAVLRREKRKGPSSSSTEGEKGQVEKRGKGKKGRDNLG